VLERSSGLLVCPISGVVRDDLRVAGPEGDGEGEDEEAGGMEGDFGGARARPGGPVAGFGRCALGAAGRALLARVGARRPRPRPPPPTRAPALFCLLPHKRTSQAA
jgi:hypothetical protein